MHDITGMTTGGAHTEGGTMQRNVNRWLGGIAVAAALLGLGGVATAQNSTGTIRGSVTADAGAPMGGVQVAARNVESGVPRGTESREDGSYVLPGIVPGTYDMTVRRIGYAPITRRVVVQIGATALQDFSLVSQTTTLSTVAVTAAPNVQAASSEVATNVTRAQIEKLPTSSRNFLDLAALSPGVTVSPDRVSTTGFRTFSAGGQTANAVNLFIDGTSLKNDLTAGGVSGQDASRGNPFPRGAIQEYRVISQNFKAEYQKASSAIITATTKSGGNKWAGSALVTYQNASLVQLDTFQRRDKANSPSTFKRPDYNRTLTSFNIGGPIIKDKMHVFGSYEGNYQNRANRVNFAATPTGFSALDTVNLSKYNGSLGSPFRENLLFGKIDDALSENSSLELSLSNRHETDVRDFGGTQAITSAINFRQNIAIGQLKYNYFKGPLLNESKVDYSSFRRNPTPNTPGTASRRYEYLGTDATIGSNRSNQDFTQKRLGLRDDLTYSGVHLAGEHIFKGGASIDFVKYDIIKDNNTTPQFTYADSVNCNPTCNPQATSYKFQAPFRLSYGTGDPNVNTNNKQIGAYIQDDWTPVERLTLNLGIRWDVETNMLNSGYRTPQTLADTLRRYASQLARPLDPNRYISDGSNRKAFLGAFQPRVGFSYGIDKESHTTLFAGWGLYYDRIPFDLYAVDPILKIRHPDYTIRFAAPGVAPTAGQVAFNPSYLTADKATLNNLVKTFGQPEAFLIDNEAKVPYSKQMNVGIRQVFSALTVTATYVTQLGYDQIGLNFGDAGSLRADGTCCQGNGFPVGAHGFSNFIYSTNDGKTWYRALTLQLERPYSRADSNSFGWGGGLAYTRAVRELQGADNLGDDFDYPNQAAIGKHLSNDERDRIVTNFITDIPYAFGIQFSGLITLGGKFRQDVGCPYRFCKAGTTGNQFTRGGFVVPGTFPYQNVDLRFRKDLPSFGRTFSRIGFTLDVFNATNHDNYSRYATGDRKAKDFGQPYELASDARRYQVGAEVNF